MAATWIQLVALSIFVPLSFVALTLPTVLCEGGSKTTPINYKPISSFSPPCSENRQENCVTHSPPVNVPQHRCDPSDHCRGDQSLMGTESMSKAQISAATKQFIALHIVVPLLLFALMLLTVLCGRLEVVHKWHQLTTSPSVTSPLHALTIA